LSALLGSQSAKAVEALLASASQPSHGLVASAVGFAALLLGATSVLAELQSSLDRIWRQPAIAQTAGWVAMLRARLFSFGMVIAMGFLLLVSLVIGAALGAIGKWGGTFIPGALVTLSCSRSAST